VFGFGRSRRFGGGLASNGNAMSTSFDAERIAPGAQLDIYIKPDCPYCAQAIAHYKHVGTPFTLHDAQNDRAARKRMFDFSANDPTVPCIVVDGIYRQSGWGTPLRG